MATTITSGGVDIVADLLRHTDHHRPNNPVTFLMHTLHRTRGGLTLTDSHSLVDFLERCTHITPSLLRATLTQSLAKISPGLESTAHLNEEATRSIIFAAANAIVNTYSRFDAPLPDMLLRIDSSTAETSSSSASPCLLLRAVYQAAASKMRVRSLAKAWIRSQHHSSSATSANHHKVLTIGLMLQLTTEKDVMALRPKTEDSQYGCDFLRRTVAECMWLADNTTSTHNDNVDGEAKVKTAALQFVLHVIDRTREGVGAQLAATIQEEILQQHLNAEDRSGGVMMKPSVVVKPYSVGLNGGLSSCSRTLSTLHVDRVVDEIVLDDVVAELQAAGPLHERAELSEALEKFSDKMQDAREAEKAAAAAEAAAAAAAAAATAATTDDGSTKKGNKKNQQQQKSSKEATDESPSAKPAAAPSRQATATGSTAKSSRQDDSPIPPPSLESMGSDPNNMSPAEEGEDVSASSAPRAKSVGDLLVVLGTSGSSSTGSSPHAAFVFLSPCLSLHVLQIGLLLEPLILGQVNSSTNNEFEAPLLSAADLLGSVGASAYYEPLPHFVCRRLAAEVLRDRTFTPESLFERTSLRTSGTETNPEEEADTADDLTRLARLPSAVAAVGDDDSSSKSSLLPAFAIAPSVFSCRGDWLRRLVKTATLSECAKMMRAMKEPSSPVGRSAPGSIQPQSLPTNAQQQQQRVKPQAVVNTKLPSLFVASAAQNFFPLYIKAALGRGDGETKAGTDDMHDASTLSTTNNHNSIVATVPLATVGPVASSHSEATLISALRMLSPLELTPPLLPEGNTNNQPSAGEVHNSRSSPVTVATTTSPTNATTAQPSSSTPAVVVAASSPSSLHATLNQAWRTVLHSLDAERWRLLLTSVPYARDLALVDGSATIPDTSQSNINNNRRGTGPLDRRIDPSSILVALNAAGTVKKE